MQVFATDIDAQAIATARAGRYPASIAGDLSPERLARFFVAEPEGSGYRIHKGIRDLLVFSEQDVIKDPPFGRLDLVSCRNLLIYLGGELQKKLIPLFHYALNPDGALFLGTSETVGEFEELFAVVDRKSKLYRRKGDLHVAQRVALGRFLAPVTATAATALALGPGAPKPAFPVKLPLRELTEQALLAQAAPAAALVDGAGDILYLHGRTGMYLEPVPGEAGISNLLKMAREGLRHELTVALHKARETKAFVRCPGLRVRTNGDFTLANLTVRPVTTGHPASLHVPLYLVTLEEAPPSDVANSAPPSGSGDRVPESSADLDALRQELRAKEEYLQTANEELETSNEELKSANEEMQSVNEELATINAELQTSLAELSRTNNDLNNLIGGTGIGTVFVDHRQRILRFTPTTTRTINLILGDVGRPIGHLVPNLVGYDSLVADTQAVLDTLIPWEAEVQTREGGWYRLRIQPYRTLANVIEGAVITFIDITEMVATREALRKANELLRLAVVVRDASDAITVQDLEGRILAWNPGAVRMYGWSEAEALAMNVGDRIPQGLREEALAKIHALSLAEVLEPYRTRMLTKSGSVVEVSITSTALVNDAGNMYAIATTERVRAPESGAGAGSLTGSESASETRSKTGYEGAP